MSGTSLASKRESTVGWFSPQLEVVEALSKRLRLLAVASKSILDIDLILLLLLVPLVMQSVPDIY